VPFSVFKPNLKLNLALGAVLGTFLGLVLAFLLEFMDDRIKSTEELDRLLGMPLLGIIPKSKQKDPLKLAMMTQSEPRSAFAEAYRSLRTNLMFSTQQGTPGVLAITSAAASEGKSTSAVNIATVFSQAGNTVLLVDTDLRNPSIHKRLQLDNSKGLTNYLTGQDHIESVTQSCQIPDVYVITAGPMSPNPVELLASERLDQLLAMAKTDTFDMIILDMPPVLGLADALVISSRADATILSVAMGESKKQAVSGALKRLRHARANIIGTIANKTKQGSGYGYNYNYDYYSYGTDKKMLDAA
jgi:capsular exopolysaccharide synthesis family protein